MSKRPVPKSKVWSVTLTGTVPILADATVTVSAPTDDSTTHGQRPPKGGKAIVAVYSQGLHGSYFDDPAGGTVVPVVMLYFHQLASDVPVDHSPVIGNTNMDNFKRKKRKLAKQRRKQALLNRHVKPTATITSYGSHAGVDFLGVVVHRGSEVIASRTCFARDYPSEKEAADEAMAFIQSHGGAKVYMVEEVLPPQYDESGTPVLNVADRLPEVVN
jgi:hypothetical protein